LRVELTITVVIADRDQVDLSDMPPGVIATLAVSSGFASADDLAAIALSCLDAGHPLVGIFVANPDPADTTTGDPSPGPHPLHEDGPLPLEPPVETAELLVRYQQP